MHRLRGPRPRYTLGRQRHTGNGDFGVHDRVAQGGLSQQFRDDRDTQGGFGEHKRTSVGEPKHTPTYADGKQEDSRRRRASAALTQPTDKALSNFGGAMRRVELCELEASRHAAVVVRCQRHSDSAV